MNAPELLSIPQAAPATTGLRLQDVSVTYRSGLTAIEAASFAIPRATITALVGVNGSGKSTLFKAIMGFVPLAAGTACARIASMTLRTCCGEPCWSALIGQM